MAMCNCKVKGSCKKGRAVKGAKSKTMKGRLDYTTKRGSKFFDRGGKRMKTAEGSSKKRLPFVK